MNDHVKPVVSQHTSNVSGEAGPGPPSAARDTGRLDDPLSPEAIRKLLEDKNAELSRLKKALQEAVGKNKGCQTIVHLFQESKQECSRLKQKCDQLNYQLCILMKRASMSDESLGPHFLQSHVLQPASLINPSSSALMGSQSENIPSFSSLGTTTTLIPQDPTEASINAANAAVYGMRKNTDKLQLDINTANGAANTATVDKNIFSVVSSREALAARKGDSSLHDEPEANLIKFSQEFSRNSLSEEQWMMLGGRETEESHVRPISKDNKDGRSVNQSRNESSRSSPSFVQINSDQEQSDNENVEPKTTSRYVSRISSGTSELNLADDIHQLTEHLSDPAVSRGESGAMIADLLRISCKAMKVEKQARIKQILIDNKLHDMEKLKQENISLKKTVEKQAEQLSAQDQLLRSSRNTFERIQDSSLSSERLDSDSADQRWDWVEVQRAAGGGAEAMVRSGSAVEGSHRGEGHRLNDKQHELAAISRHWQDKYLQLSEDMKQKMNALEEEKRSVVHESEKVLKKHSDDIIELNTLLAKEALQLDSERQKRREAEDSCAAIDARRVQLEREVEMLSARQLEPVDAYFLKSSELPSTAPPSLGESDLKSQLLLLRQQVTVFKEDFDQERRDREKAKNEAEECKKEIMALKMKHISIGEQLQKARGDLAAVQNENRTLKEHCEKVSRDFHSLLRNRLGSPPIHHRPEQLHIQPMQHHQLNQQLQLQQQYQQLQQLGYQRGARTEQLTSVESRQWPCRICTYLNASSRTSCEICGEKRSPDHHQIIATSVMPSQAGPPFYQCDVRTLPYPVEHGPIESPGSRATMSGDVEVDLSQRK